jgi:hypothetical protein
MIWLGMKWDGNGTLRDSGQRSKRTPTPSHASLHLAKRRETRRGVHELYPNMTMSNTGSFEVDCAAIINLRNFFDPTIETHYIYKSSRSENLPGPHA